MSMCKLLLFNGDTLCFQVDDKNTLPCLFQKLGCRDYNTECYYCNSGKCVLRPSMNKQMEKVRPT